MRYWEAMNDKYGFGDGEELPTDAWQRREAYVRLLNALAEVRGSRTRVVCFDRGGFHNPCMVLLVESRYVRDPEVLAGKKATDWEGLRIPAGIDEPKPDAIFAGIIDEMGDGAIAADSCVKVVATVDHDEIGRIIEAERKRGAKARKPRGGTA